MRPDAYTFVPSAPVASPGFDDANFSLQALARSLATEQHAHHATQMTLGEAMSKISELEAAMARTKDHNKSLTSTVNMLKGIIRHNQHKLSEEDLTSTKVDRIEAEPVKNPSPIFYDVLAEQYKERLRRSSEEDAIVDDTASLVDSAEFKLDVDSSDLFNFDLLRSPIRGDSSGSALRNALRGRLSKADEEAKFNRFSQKSTPFQREDRLISVSPEDSPAANELNFLMAASQKPQDETGTVATARTKTNTKVFLPQVDGSDETDGSQWDNKPVLKLVSCILPMDVNQLTDFQA